LNQICHPYGLGQTHEKQQSSTGKNAVDELLPLAISPTDQVKQSRGDPNGGFLNSVRPVGSPDIRKGGPDRVGIEGRRLCDRHGDVAWEVA